MSDTCKLLTIRTHYAPIVVLLPTSLCLLYLIVRCEFLQSDRIRDFVWFLSPIKFLNSSFQNNITQIPFASFVFLGYEAKLQQNKWFLSQIFPIPNFLARNSELNILVGHMRLFFLAQRLLPFHSALTGSAKSSREDQVLLIPLYLRII